MHLGNNWFSVIHCQLVLSLRIVHPLMGKLRTKSYTLRNGEVVTCRSVSNKIGVSESAARARLNRSDDPKKIYAPFSPTKPRKKDNLPKNANLEAKAEEARLWRIVMQMGIKKYD